MTLRQPHPLPLCAVPTCNRLARMAGAMCRTHWALLPLFWRRRLEPSRPWLQRWRNDRAAAGASLIGHPANKHLAAKARPRAVAARGGPDPVA